MVNFIGVNLKSQSSIGIVPGSVSISPSDTVVDGTTIFVFGSFVNTGSVSLTGTVVVNMAIDTSSNSMPTYVFRNFSTYSVTAFAPSAVQSFSITDVASGTNQYKTNGNGTTVVVWPVFNGNISTTSDSAKKTIVVHLSNSIDDLALFENDILKIKNPISQNVELKYDNLIYQIVALTNINGQTVQIIQNNTLNVTLLSKGLYYLNFYNAPSGKCVTKKIIID
jgi:hypothetical protein